MDSLPFHLFEVILFKLDRKSLAMMQCTEKSINSHISDDPYFKSEYLSRFRLMDHSESKLLPEIVCGSETESKLECDNINQSDGTSQMFKTVRLIEVETKNPDVTMYRFEIKPGLSRWRLSKTTVTCSSSFLKPDKKPVYFQGALHWSRNDGSMVAFDPETEQARLIPIKFSHNVSSEIVRETKEEGCFDGVVHGGYYDLGANKWGVVGSIRGGCDSSRDFSSAMEVDEKVDDVITMVGHDKRISSLSTMIMRLIDQVSPNVQNLLWKKETQLGKRLLIEEEEEDKKLKRKVRSGSKFLNVESINKRIRVK